jgi:hypothetical protein
MRARLELRRKPNAPKMSPTNLCAVRSNGVRKPTARSPDFHRRLTAAMDGEERRLLWVAAGHRGKNDDREESGGSVWFAYQ